MSRLTRRTALAIGGAALAGGVLAPAVHAADFPAPLVGLRPARPRLLTTPEDLAGLEQRLAADEVGQKWRAALLREADRLLTQKPVDYTFEPKRPVLLPTSREVLKRMENLGVAWLLTKDARYARRIVEELRRVCGFDTWHPPHFLDVAEMTMAVAIAYDWTRDALSPADRDMTRKALV